MKNQLYRIGILAGFLSSLLPGGTVTTKDHWSVNGTVLEMQGDEILILAGYSSGEKKQSIKAADVAIIDFEGPTYNSGPPDRTPGIGPAKQAAAVKAAAPSKTAGSRGDVVILKGGKTQPPCKVTSIDSRYVHCSGTDFERASVYRILFLAPR
jgi:hypothetical protein